jgi:hypothetical protein
MCSRVPGVVVALARANIGSTSMFHLGAKNYISIQPTEIQLVDIEMMRGRDFPVAADAPILNT